MTSRALTVKPGSNIALALKDQSPEVAEELKEINGRARRMMLYGWIVIGVFFGGIGTWMATAPLESAALAPGTISAQNQNKSIQHLEGGIVEKILVRDGDHVESGQVLVLLDKTRALSNLGVLETRYVASLAEHSRLVAERDDKDDVSFPAELVSRRNDPEIAELISGQQEVFHSRKAAMQSQIAILKQRVTQLNKEIDALQAQADAEKRQINLIKEEIVGVKQLYDKGLERKPRLLALQRAQADIEGDRGNHLALIARAQQSVGETELRIVDLQTQVRDQVTTRLSEVQAEVTDLKDRISAAQDTLNRTEIRAPRSGVVTGLQVHTIGGVIGPGQVLLDLVPQDDNLIIEARVSPQDIDIVHVGLSAQIRLSVYSRRTVPTVEGEVIHVSADSFVDQATGEPYYRAQVELDPSSIDPRDNIVLYPGMPTEVMIRTGKQTVLEYILAPITRMLARSFKAQ